MAKELPYFKFEPSAWDNGNIQVCSLESKGLFIDICSMYWARMGELPYALALQKHCKGNTDALQELIDADVILVKEQQIIIEFLDEQLAEFIEIGKKRASAANKRWDANAMQVQCKSNAKREEEIRKEEIREELNVPFDYFWSMYDKKVDRAKCEKKWVRLTDAEREECMYYLPAYVKATPDIKFRRNPEKYLNNKSWQNEIVEHGTDKKNSGATSEQILSAVNKYFPIEGYPGKG
jgi:hypothetical protein